MRPHALGLAILLAGTAPAAFAQDPAAGTLTYSQVLTPDAVLQVQDRLHAVGAFNGTIDGTWGADSAAALQHFQQTSGLQVTGQLNQATLATLGIAPATLLSAPSGGQPTSAPAAPFALSADSVRIVQSRLQQLGFYASTVDGVWGPATISGIQAFQRSQGLPVTNGLNSATVTAMGIDTASMTPR